MSWSTWLLVSESVCWLAAIVPGAISRLWRSAGVTPLKAESREPKN